MSKKLVPLVLALVMIAAVFPAAAAIAGDGGGQVTFVANPTPTTTPTPPPGAVPIQGVPGAYLVPPATGNYSVSDNGITTKEAISFWWTPTEDQLGIWVVRFRVTDPGGLSDFEDVTITVYSPLDANRDLAINVLDLIMVGQHFQEPAPVLPEADINGDGAIDVLDLISVAQGEWKDYNVTH